jgi:hypothetical protein
MKRSESSGTHVENDVCVCECDCDCDSDDDGFGKGDGCEIDCDCGRGCDCDCDWDDAISVDIDNEPGEDGGLERARGTTSVEMVWTGGTDWDRLDFALRLELQVYQFVYYEAHLR